MRGLGHAVGLDQRRAERRLHLADHLRRHRGGRRAQEPQRDVAAITSLLRGARARIAWCMVGTAVTQVGRAVLHLGEEAQRVEARRAELPPRRATTARAAPR